MTAVNAAAPASETSRLSEEVRAGPGASDFQAPRPRVGAVVFRAHGNLGWPDFAAQYADWPMEVVVVDRSGGARPRLVPSNVRWLSRPHVGFGACLEEAMDQLQASYVAVGTASDLLFEAGVRACADALHRSPSSAVAAQGLTHLVVMGPNGAAAGPSLAPTRRHVINDRDAAVRLARVTQRPLSYSTAVFEATALAEAAALLRYVDSPYSFDWGMTSISAILGGQFTIPISFRFRLPRHADDVARSGGFAKLAASYETQWEYYSVWYALQLALATHAPLNRKAAYEVITSIFPYLDKNGRRGAPPPLDGTSFGFPEPWASADEDAWSLGSLRTESAAIARLIGNVLNP